MLYNGQSNYKNTFYSNARQATQKKQQNSTQLARMRFNIQVEKAAQKAALKDAEIRSAQAAAQKRHDDEMAWR